MPAVKSNRPVNLSMGQVLEVNLKSPVAIASILTPSIRCHRIFTRTGTSMDLRQVIVFA